MTSRHPREPSLAPLARVIDQRPCTRARLRAFFQIRNAMSRNYFLMPLMPIWRDILRCASCDSAATSVRFEHKDSLSWQRFTSHQGGLVPTIHALLYCRMRGGWVYFMTDRPDGILYAGVTSNLPRRAFEHWEELISSFTKRHGLKSRS